MSGKPKKLLFRLILIGLLSGVLGCNLSASVYSFEDSGVDPEGMTDTDTDSEKDTDTDSETETDTETDSEICDNNSGFEQEHYSVPSPPDGVPANLNDICLFEDDVANSNKAATVQLDQLPNDYSNATGQITLADGLAEKIVGTPQIEMTEAFPNSLMSIDVTNTVLNDNGYSFNLSFTEDVWLNPGQAEITIRVTVELLCDDDSGDTKMVDSITYLHFCDDYEYPTWVSSGGECTVCGEVCEKIASPLSAAYEENTTALVGSPVAKIIPVAHYGRNLILFVDKRSTQGPLSYTWKASGGEITGSNKAGVIWKVPKESGEHLIQVAVKDNNSAVVATMSWRHNA